MSARVLATLLAIALLLEVAAGLTPSFGRLFEPLLIVAGLTALTGRPWLAIAGALLSGGLADGWSARWFGLNTFTHLVIAFPISSLARRFDLLAPVPAAIVLALIGPLSWWVEIALCAFFDVPRVDSPGWLAWISLAAVNGTAGFAAYRVLRGRDWIEPT